MATYTIPARKIGVYSKTLAANTVDSVEFASEVAAVEVGSNGSGKIFFTIDGSAPSVGGQNTYELPAIVCVRTVNVPRGGDPTDEPTVVKLISAGTPEYSVSRARAEA